MPAQSSAQLRDPSDIHDVAASICFQSAGQVVTVLGKIDRHFDEAAVAGFAKQAVAEYAAKQNAQLVAVTIMQHAGQDSPDDAQHFTHDGQDYAITIGNLADERTQMDHLTRVMERLKYLQAVMVMLSTTDMLGTSQALGKHMGGMTARLQQVQKIGLQLEKLASRIEEAKKRNQPLSQKVFEKQLATLLTQMQKLQTGAPPELRRVLQTMIAQVKELRQLPIFTNQSRVAVAPLKVVSKNDAVQKTEHRFKAQPAKLALRVVEGGRVAQLQNPRIALQSRMMPNIFRIPVASLAKIAAQIKPANDNRFRVTQSIVARIAQNGVKQASTPVQLVKSSISLPVQRRFTVLSVAAKLPAVLLAALAAMAANIQPVARQTVQAQVQPRGINPQVISPIRSIMPKSVMVQAATLHVAQVATPIVAQPSVLSVAQTISQPVAPAPIASSVQSQIQPIAATLPAQQVHIAQVKSDTAPISTDVQRTQNVSVMAQGSVAAKPVEIIKSAEGVQQGVKVLGTAIPKTQDSQTNNQATPRGKEGVATNAAQQAAPSTGARVEIGNAGASENTGTPLNPRIMPAPPVPAALSITASPSTPAGQPPLPQQGAVTSVPVVPRTGDSTSTILQVPTTAEPAKQPIIQQYKQAAQDLGERVVRGAQEFRIQTQNNVRNAASYIGSVVEKSQQFAIEKGRGADALFATLSDKTKSILRVFNNAKGIICCKTGGNTCNCTREASKMEVQVVNNANLALA